MLKYRQPHVSLSMRKSTTNNKFKIELKCFCNFCYQFCASIWFEWNIKWVHKVYVGRRANIHLENDESKCTHKMIQIEICRLNLLHDVTSSIEIQFNSNRHNCFIHQAILFHAVNGKRLHELLLFYYSISFDNNNFWTVLDATTSINDFSDLIQIKKSIYTYFESKLILTKSSSIWTMNIEHRANYHEMCIADLFADSIKLALHDVRCWMSFDKN